MSINSKIFLLSASPRRLELLENLGCRVAQLRVPFDEPKGLNFKDPKQFLTSCLDAKQEQSLSYLRHKKEIHNIIHIKPVLFLVADTTVCAGEQILGKPIEKKGAFEMLKSMQGKKHEVFTGYSLWISCGELLKVQKKWRRIVKTEVRFKKMNDAWLKRYINSGEPMDKAGSYGVQGMGLQMIESINGSYSSVMGLPLNEVLEDLEKAEKYL